MKQQVNFVKKAFLFITISSLLKINDSMATVIRQIIEKEATLSTGIGLDEKNPFLSGSVLQFSTDNITKIDCTATAIQAIDINGKRTKLSDDPKDVSETNFQFFGDCSLGSVINSINDQQMTVSIGQAKVENTNQENIEATLTLTGTSISEFQTQSNNYTAISKIFFGSHNSTLTIKSADNQPIHFDGIFDYSKGSLLGTTLNVISNFLVQHQGIANIHQINIGSNEGSTKPAILAVNFGIEGDFDFLTNKGTINFLDEESRLLLQNNQGGKRTVSLHGPLASQDKKGKVELNATGKGNELTIQHFEVEGRPGLFVGTIGSKDLLLGELIATGDSNIIVDMPVFAESVEEEGTGTSTLTFNKEVTANVNFHDVSTTVAKDNIIGNIDYKNLNAKVTIENGRKIEGNVISTGGKNGELNFPAGGEVTGNIGDEKNGIKDVNLAKEILKLANARADINFNGASTLLANGNITGTLDFKNSNSKIMLAKDKKITGEVVSSGGANGEINFEDSGEVAGDIGASDKEIMSVNIKQGNVKLADVNAKNIKLDDGTVEFAGSNLRTIVVPALTIDKDQLKRSIERFNYKTKVNVDQFNINNNNGVAKFNESAFIEKPVQGGVLEFKDDIWLNNAIVKANKVTFGANKSAVLAHNIEANNIIADQAKIVILENMSIIGNFTAKDMALDLSNKVLTVTDTKKFSGNMEIDSSYDSSKLEGGYINITAGGKIQFSEIEKMIINVTIKSNIDQVPIGTKYALVRAENNGSIEGPPKSVVLNIKDQNRFTEWEIDKEGKNLFLYSTPIQEETTSTDHVLVKPGSHEETTGTMPIVPTEHASTTITSDSTDHVLVKPGSHEETTGTIPIVPTEHASTTITSDSTDHVLVKPGSHEETTGTIPIVPTEHASTTITPPVSSTVSVHPQTVINSNTHGSGGTGTSCNARIIQNLNATSEQQKFAQQLVNVLDHNSDAAKFKHMLCDMLKEGRVEESRDATNRLISRTVPFSTVMDSIVFAATQEIHNRMAELGRLLNNQVPTIQSAGEEVRQKSGVWVSAFYSQASQKLKNEISGYKLKASGGMIGIDSQINDNLLIGGAYSRSQAIISHKNAKNGDKTKANVNIFLLYGLQHLTDRWYVEGILSYAASKVKNHEGRRVWDRIEQAVGKYNAISYGGQLVNGYNYPINNTDITPLIGVRYTKFKEGNYPEAGASYENLTVKKRVYDKIEALVGMRVSTTITLEQKMKPLILVPELYGMINYDLKGKSLLIDARLQGMNEPLPNRTFKAAKVFFNCGFVLTAQYNNTIEYGIKYNAVIAKKYLAHHPSLKLKIYF